MIYSEGKNRITVGQVKRYFNELPKNTQDRTIACLNEMLTDGLPVVRHGVHKIVSKHIKPTRRTIKSIENGDYTVIEANIVCNNELRVLIRSNAFYYSNVRHCNVNLCLVISITGQCVVTAYENRVEDTHDTIDGSRYI